MNKTAAVVFVALAALLGIHAPARAATLSAPTEVRASYQIHKSGILIGTVEETFVREGDSYRIVSDTRTAGALRIFMKDRLTITAAGRIGQAGLEPMSYDFRRERNQAKNLSARFDWGLRQIVSTHDSTTERFELPRGTLDRVSAMYQFMFAAPGAEQISAWMSQGKKAEQYLYRKQGEPLLQLGGKQYATLHYAREVKPGESRAQLWLAKDQYYLPVRMVFEDNNVSLEQTLVALSAQ